MPKESPKLDPWYLTGLVEGEGCFTISFSLRKKMKLGIETRPSFSISLNRRDLALLEQVQGYFGCGSIRYSRSDRTYKFESRSVADLVKRVIPHFEKYKLRGSKRNDFDRFSMICRSVRANHHRSIEYLVGIIDKAYEMNPSGKRRHEKRDLLRVLSESKV